MEKEERLVIAALAYIRGRSLSNSYFIVDEAQNLTPHEIKTIITRAGEGTKMVFTGDLHQIDSPYLDHQSNGLAYLSTG
jgi:PhoH-like ATPase